MKKLLLIIVLFAFSFVSGQILVPPPDITLCDTGNGFAMVDLGMQTPGILGGASPNAYTVSYHSTQLDADQDLNPLPMIVTLQGSMMIFVRMEDNAAPANYALDSFMVTIMQAPNVTEQQFTQCDNDNVPTDGMTYIDLGSIMEQIWSSTSASPNEMTISFYLTYQDAQAQANPITAFVNTQPNQVIYASCQYNTTGCTTVIPISLIVANCSGTCPAPQSTIVTNITATSAVIGWLGDPTVTAYEVMILPFGSPVPTQSNAGIPTTINPFVITGLSCSTLYDIYVRSVCSATEMGMWTSGTIFSTMGCVGSGQPLNLAECTDNGTACFNLTVNTQNVLGNLNPADYTVSYHTSYADASANTAAIATATSYCVPVTMVSPEIFIRLENNSTGEYQIFSFGITAQEVVAGNIPLLPMVQCDDDGNGTVTFNLTTIAAQLNTGNALYYYADSNDAVNGVNLMANPSSVVFNAGVTAPIFVREIVIGGCDIVHSFQVSAMDNCNVATICAGANSLCNSLGVPFSNTVNGAPAEPGNDYNCLGSQPNPTWFYIPVSTAGSISLTMSQLTVGGTPIDLDFICYGPYPNPVTPCSGMLNANYVVGCSYSAAAVENVTIQNAQPGQYYLLMVTNFSNQPGYITISQTGGQAEIDCTGLRLNAFLDANSNGVKDSGEQNFPLGQFHYEKNSDGNIHNITAPTGIYNIYDLNASNSYNLSYTVDGAYASNYSVSTPSYSNVSVIAGGGMQQYLFPVTVAQSYNDLAVSIIPNLAPRPGFQYTNTVMYTNLGTQTAASGTVTFVKDPLVSIVGNTQTGTVANANGFTYNFTNLLPFEVRQMTVTMQVPTIPTVTIGNSLVNNASIAPLAGDVSPENNASIASQVIIGSYDPNDKMESHGERVLFSGFTSQDYLYYTVRFENTGTASAINVRISDVLDNKLDETSVRMVSASHNYVLDRVDNMLNWRFDNIQLPTTTQNPTGGKGYVYFKVKPKPGYAIGDIIPNTASIFFDYNPAIVTNTFHTEFVTSLGIGEVDAHGFAMYPNPAGDHVTVSLSGNSGNISNVALYDMLGKTVLSKKPAAGATVETVDISAVSSGMYFLEVVTDKNIRTVKKLSVE
jgi:uncharacterized repeat protein (TIGR01451 family)